MGVVTFWEETMDPKNFDSHLAPNKTELDQRRNSRKLAGWVRQWKERLEKCETSEEIDELEKEVDNKLSGIMQSDDYSLDGIQAACASWGNWLKWRREELTKGGKS
jgi:hypothetical protein